MPKIAVIGTTSWGVTLAILLARKKYEVSLWARSEQEAAEFAASKQNSGIVPPGAQFPPNLSITSSLDDAVDSAQAVILAVPSQKMRQNIKLVAGYLSNSTLIISAAKGLEISSRKRMSLVIAEEVEPRLRHNICVLSGPNLAPEIMKGLPSATVIASAHELTARKAQKLLSSPNLCVYTNTDVIGVELGGSLKNIIALGAGIADGLGYGDNAKAALITRGLTEMTALGVSLGANPLTFSGLAGLGDLIATCASPLSRNHYVGVELTKGRSLQEITGSMSGVAEGVTTTLVVWELAKEMGLAMPVTEGIHSILYEGTVLKDAVAKLMQAEAYHELTGRKWQLSSFLRRSRVRSS